MDIQQALDALQRRPNDRETRKRFLEVSLETVQESLLRTFGRYGAAYEDLLQATLCRFFVGILKVALEGRLDPSRNIEAYLRTMASNAFRDELRAMIRDPLYAAVSFQSEGEQEPGVIDPDRDVLELLQQLEEDEQELIRLRLSGHEFAKVAAVLGVTPETARKRYTRIIEKLRRLFFQ